MECVPVTLNKFMYTKTGSDVLNKGYNCCVMYLLSYLAQNALELILISLHVPFMKAVW